ncbi:hypothetical protein [Roseofilum casamattae]|uniref:Uncharacterized protein n=1 Tax=Roseofilum casamattae BLCC-M143 TaxID=3022442 RepID=A0ABT7BZC1_9CYAN|nr:hypothetical protein [Roseofilum casamattae]MDJ1184415.1 hypothetical protein [Roseofilum casamattae BLCC-M143]
MMKRNALVAGINRYPFFDEAEIDDVWERLDKALARAAVESGMDRETLIDALDPSKPFPFENELQNIAMAASSEIKTAEV